MKKTLLVTTDFFPDHGGIARYWEKLGEHMSTDSWVVLAPVRNIVDSFLYPIYRREFFPSWLSLFWLIPAIVRRERIEHIIIGQILPIGTAVWLLSYVLNIPYSVSLHGMDISVVLRIPRKKWLCKKILKQAHRIIVNSRFTASQLEAFGDFTQKIHIVYPCPGIIPLKKYEKSQIPHTILTVSRLVERKGIQDTIVAVRMVKNEFPDIHYTVIGDGSYRCELEKCVNENDLSDSVQFLGFCSDDDIARYYAQSSVFVLTPREIDGDVEGFGIVYLEANAFGVPVIGTRSGGVSEAVIDDETGILVDEGNPEHIAGAILKLLRDSELRKKLGMQGKARVEREFQWKIQVEKIKFIL